MSTWFLEYELPLGGLFLCQRDGTVLKGQGDGTVWHKRIRSTHGVERITESQVPVERIPYGAIRAFLWELTI